MNLPWLPRTSGAKSDVAVSTDLDTNVNTAKEESQGAGQINKLIAKKGATVNINVSVINNNTVPKDPIERGKFVDELKRAFNSGEVQFVEQQASADLSGYNETIKDNNSVEDVIRFLEGKIPPDDLWYIQTGLYVKKLLEDGRGVDAKRIKENACRDSQRARNIVNLVSAGFLEGYVLPIYEADSEYAVECYNELVEEMPGMIFVSQMMNATDVIKHVEERVQNREKYHWEVKSISVNGLNNCIKTIEEIKPLLEVKYPEFEISLNTSEAHKIRRGELRIVFP